MNPRNVSPRNAFTLIEVMVSTVIVVILAGILISATDLTAKSFSRTSAKIEQFSEARRGFEVVTRRLAEATLNTYWDYYNDKGEARPTLETRKGEKNYSSFVSFLPSSYGRQSELRFVSGPMNTGTKEAQIDPASTADRPTHGVFFQAPVGEVDDREKIGMLDQTLNSWGYFLEISEDRDYIPIPLAELNKPRRRSRLMEFRQPTEQNPIYFPPYSGDAANQTSAVRNWWFVDSINKETDRPVRVVAENMIALIVLPRLSRNDETTRAKDPKLSIASADDDRGVLCPSYFYDSALNANGIRVTPSKPLAVTDKPEEVNPKNQLPPTVQVIMVALDENSAARLDESTKDKPGFDLKTEDIFKRSVRLEDNATTDAPNDGELHELEQKLIDQRLTYRVFNSTVIIRGAKWSRAQSN